MSERAVSVPVNYTFSIVIVTLLLSGLVIVTTDNLQAQQERTIESDFDVLSNRMAADVTAADHLAGSTGGTESDVVAVRTEMPSRSADTGYLVHFNSTEIDDGAYAVTIRMESTSLGITKETGLKTNTKVTNTTIVGGDYAIEYVGDGVPDELEVRND